MVCESANMLSALLHYQLKNKNMPAGTTELVAEVGLNQKDMNRLESLRYMPGVLEITVMRSVSGNVL